VSLWHKGQGTGQSFQLGITVFDRAGTVLGQYSNLAVATSSTNWQFIESSLNIPARAAYFIVQASMTSSNPADLGFIRLDDIGYTVAQPVASRNKGKSSCNEGIHAGAKLSLRPVNLQSGEKYEEVTDLAVMSPAGSIHFTRAYRQDLAKDSSALPPRLGMGWTHNHNLTLTDLGGSPKTLLLRLSTGGESYFEETSVGSNQFQGDPGSTASITFNGTYTLAVQGQSVFQFSSSGALLSQTTQDGLVWNYTYYGAGHVAQGLLQTVFDTDGRGLQFSYIDHSGFFDHLQIWRVGDQSATGLDGSNPSGSYIEFGYSEERLSGAVVTSPRPLLASVRDVRGSVWTYAYYGQQTTESNAALANALTKWISPTVDLNGDGIADSTIILKQVQYSHNGTRVTDLVQARGIVGIAAPLEETNWVMQPSGTNTTTETRAGRTTTYNFRGGVYFGSENSAGTQRTIISDQYREEYVEDANGNGTMLRWSSDGKTLDWVQDSLQQETYFDYTDDLTYGYRLSRSIDSQGRITEYTYDVGQQPITIKSYDLDSVTVLRHQTFSYDAKGRVLTEREIDPDPNNGGNVLQETTRTYYTTGDGAGLLQTLTRVDSLDPGNNQSTTYTYDSAGRVIKTQQSSLLGSCQFSYTVYDLAGNVMATVCSSENRVPPITVEEMIDTFDPSDPDKAGPITNTCANYAARWSE